MDNIYPIGSIFISTNTTNPSTYFGGTWERITGRFLLAADDSTYKIGSTGGEKTHKLTVNEMPRHKHTNWTSQGGSWARETMSCGNKTTHDEADYGNMDYAGGDQAHNNLQPYIVVYMFKRVS